MANSTKQRRFGTGLVMVAVVAALGACASPRQADVHTSAAGGGADCGKVGDLKTTGNADLSSLPEEVRAGYAGYFAPVNTSAYADFKSGKSQGFVIGYSDSFSANPWRAAALARLKQNAESWKQQGLISDFVATNSNLDNNLQIQQITSMINQHVDAIIAIPNSPTAFDGVIKQAHDAKIPFITMNSHVDSPYAINIDPNYFLTGAKVAAGLAEKIGKKGNVVIVDGINGAPASTQMHNGYLEALKACPDIKVAGSVEGQWNEATAKTVMLQYLATHPGNLDGTLSSGGMSLGIIQAMRQSGRTVAPTGDTNPDKGAVLTFRDTMPDKYIASTAPPTPSADAAFYTAVATLLGQGPKYDAIVANPPAVSGKPVLDQWAKSDWQKDDSTVAPAPPGSSFFPSDMSVFFQHPSALPALPALP